ncbi:hypothetical protein AB4K20DRAFT_1864536 [Rhizopus microsporus]
MNFPLTSKPVESRTENATVYSNKKKKKQYYEKQGDEQLSSKEDIEDLDDVIAIVKKQIKTYHRYSNEEKLLFVYYNRIKLFNAAKSGRLSGDINERTAQK